MRLHDLRQGLRGQVAIAEFQGARQQIKIRAGPCNITKLLERDQKTPRGGARNAGAFGDVRKRLPWFCAEAFDDGEPAFEGLDEIPARRADGSQRRPFLPFACYRHE